MADYTQGLPDVQDLLGNLIGQIQPNMKATQDQMGAMQDYIKNQQRDQLNIPALQFAAGLLKPTRTGSFGESLGNAGEGALGALQKQREIDLDRQAKILELTQAKSQMLAQQAQMLTPYWQMQQASKLADTLAPGGGGGGSAAGGGGPSGGGAPGGDENAWERATILSGPLGAAGKGVEAAAGMHMRFGAGPAGARTAAEEAAKFPYIGPKALAENLNKPFTWKRDGTDVSGTFGQYLQETGKTPDLGPIPNPQIVKMPPPAPTPAPPAAAAAAPPPAPGAAVIPEPAAQGPIIDPATAEVKSYVPPPPPGGGLPPIPPGATGNPPGYDEQMKEAAKVPAEWSKEYGDLDTMKNRLRELNYLGKLTESNQWATSKSEIASHLKAIALAYDPSADTSKMDADKWGKPAETQQTIKDVTQLAMAAARAQGARGTNMVLQEAMLTTPQPDMQPAARWTLINHNIAAIDRSQQLINDWQAAQANGWKDPNVFKQQWLKANPIDKWVQATSQKAGNFAGMPLPKNLHVGAVYVAPKGSKHDGELGVWNGQSFDPPDPNDLTGMGPK